MNHITRNDKWLVGICSLMHFLVDGLCVCTLYLMSWPFTLRNLFGIFLTYNLLAFITQPLTGYLADRLRHRQWLLLTSVGLLALAVVMCIAVTSFETLKASWMAMFVVASLLGMGNSLFHVWGGKLTAVNTGNDIRALGVFVATGAFGLSVGLLFYSWWLLVAFLLLIVCAMMLALRIEVRDHSRKPDFVPQRLPLLVVWLSIVALMGFVMFRSYVGQSFTTAMVKTEVVVLMVGAVSMIGKMAGGWVAKWLGIVWSMVAIVVVVGLCLLFKGTGMPVLWLGLFAINCTMPITLYLANLVMPGREGLAFGLLAAALMPGYLLS